MSFVSFAQNFEDVLLWRALHDVEKGQYIDIGAQDPELDSVSLAFYEAGWRGIHVEPVPFYAARLREARPDETVIEAAVTDAPGPIRFYEIPETGLSTSSKGIAEKHKSAGFAFRQIAVPCTRLDRLLEMVDDDFHWMKIDVEGMESDVLRSWGQSPRRPWIVTIESTFPSSQEPTHQAWIEEVLHRGYQEVFFDGLSRYFLHENHASLACRFEAPANVFDRFSVALHHFSAAGARSQLETRNQQLNEERARAGQLEGELERSQRHAAEERERAEQLGVELSQTQAECEAARQDEIQALERLLAAEQDHRAAVETLLHDSAETERRRSEVEQRLRQDLLDTGARLASASVELARFEERSGQLQDKLDREDELTRRAEVRVEALEERLAQSAAALEETRTNLNQQIAEARSEGGRVAVERDETRAEADRVARERDEARAEADHRRNEADRLEAALVRAEALIKAAVAEGPDRWARIGEALGLARERHALRALAGWDGSSARMSHPQAAQLEKSDVGIDFDMNSSAPLHARNPYLRANSLSELLSWHDVDFVRCAFVTVLGRQPDREGERYYTARIRAGHSKAELLWQLRRSSEASRHDPGIGGFDRAVKRAALGRLPLIGPVLRLFTRTESDSQAARRWRSLTNSIEFLRELQERNFARLNGQVEALNELGLGGSAAAAADSTGPKSFLLTPAPTAPLSDRAKDIFAAMANVR